MFLIQQRSAHHLRLLIASAVCCSALIGSSLFAAPGAAVVVAAMTPEMRALRERIEKAPLGVAGLHRSSSGSMKCEKCHGGAVAPDDNQTVENRECVSCHEGYTAVAALSAKKLSNPALNAHASHLAMTCC